MPIDPTENSPAQNSPGDEPVDPDRGPGSTGPGPGADAVPFPVLLAIAVGGALGAAARYGAGRAWPDPPGAVAWTTLGINVIGCLLIGVLMPIVVERGRGHPLLRPLLGTGVLGGFTTFSTYAVDAQSLLAAGRWGAAVGYLMLTLLAAVAAVALGQLMGRRMGRRSAAADRPG